MICLVAYIMEVGLVMCTAVTRNKNITVNKYITSR